MNDLPRNGRATAVYDLQPSGIRLVGPTRGCFQEERIRNVSAIDKAKNKADELAGQAKERIGQATGDTHTENEGKADQVKSNLKDAGEKVKDAFRH